MKTITKILIANRGEIAVRIIRTCREMGIKTVAIFSEADRKALHVRMADEAYCVGPAPSAESYLVVDKILEVAKLSGADAIHPGFGFLSEKAHFSQACEDAGIIFIGPRPNAISSMGDKIAARKLAEKANVPTVPGTEDPVASWEEVKTLAETMGFPILIKAAAGGGGKGMRVVSAENELKSSFEMASQEALKSFGDERVYVEKFIKDPRHVEIQIIRDSSGKGLFLFERECSAQRRHQKIVEEAPCVYLKEDVRKQMAQASLNLADEVDYLGVGTIEYLVDDEQNFYFLEMNTRIQVEHTVTEMITGLDLVRMQIQVAQGLELSQCQEDILPRGHAIQCRIYAEDPERNFMPSPGTIEFLEPPEGAGIRHDSGVHSGSEIPIHYDPMIAKLVVYSSTRDLAIEKMLRALSEYKLSGVTNNIGFLKHLVGSEVFRKSEVHTQYIDHHEEIKQIDKKNIPLDVAFAIAALEKLEGVGSSGSTEKEVSTMSTWKRNQLL